MNWVEFIETLDMLKKLSRDGWIFRNDAHRLELYHQDYGMYRFFSFEQLNSFLNRWDFDE